MIKTATEGYITIKLFTHYGDIAIPTGKIDGDKAEFLLVYSRHPERHVWLRREDIY